MFRIGIASSVLLLAASGGAVAQSAAERGSYLVNTISVAANITSHPTAGIGAWSDEKIGRAINHGIARDGRTLKTPMAFTFYAGLKPPDLADIIAWLRTVPPLQ